VVLAIAALLLQEGSVFGKVLVEVRVEDLLDQIGEHGLINAGKLLHRVVTILVLW
jgi:hypothetical protein